MTHAIKSDRRGGPDSVLVLSERQQFLSAVALGLPGDDKRKYTAEPRTLAAMNGKASALIARHDVVVFDAPPADSPEFRALPELIAAAPGQMRFLALADAGLSIAEARHLREIGIDDVLPDNVTGPELETAIDALLEARRGTQVEQDSGDSGKLIAVSQARGGIGATTVAVNLARKLVGGGGRFRKAETRQVVLVDLDLQFGNANTLLDLEDNGALVELLSSGEILDPTLLAGTLQSHKSGMTVMCAPAALVPLHAITPETVGFILDMLRDQYDYVVVDLPRALIEWVAPVIDRADRLAIVTDTTVASLRQAKRLSDFYREGRDSLPIDIVVNRERKRLFKPPLVKEAEEILETKIAHWLPDAGTSAREAADLGQPLVDLEPGARFSKAIGRLAEATDAALAAEAGTVKAAKGAS